MRIRHRVALDSYTTGPTPAFEMKTFAHSRGFSADQLDNLVMRRQDGYSIHFYPANGKIRMKIKHNNQGTIFLGLKPPTLKEAEMLFTLLNIN